MICDVKHEDTCAKFSRQGSPSITRFWLEAVFYHLILCEQVTLLIIGAEHDVIKGGMFYPCSNCFALLTISHEKRKLPRSLFFLVAMWFDRFGWHGYLLWDILIKTKITFGASEELQRINSLQLDWLREGRTDRQPVLSVSHPSLHHPEEAAQPPPVRAVWLWKINPSSPLWLIRTL